MTGSLLGRLGRKMAHGRVSLTRALGAFSLERVRTAAAGAVTEVRMDPDTVYIDGFVPSGFLAIRAVVATVDGAVMSAAKVKPGDHGSCWAAEIPRERLAPGNRSVGALIVRRVGLVQFSRPVNVEVTASGRVGVVDRPADGEEVRGNLDVAGWVLTDRGYDRVEVRVGRCTPVTARLLASPRPDIEDLVDDQDAPLAGWHAVVPIRGDSGADVPVVVEATGSAGRVTLGRRRVHCLPSESDRDPKRAKVLAERTSLLAPRHRPDDDGLHLLVATHHLGIGGGQLYLQELLRLLVSREGVRCTVLSAADGTLRDELETWGAQVQVVGSAPLDGVGYEHWLHQLAAVAITTRANCVVANTAGAFWGVDLAARLGIPSVWAVHESWAPEDFLHIGLGSPDDFVAGRFLSAFRQAGAVVFEADATLQLYEHLIREGRAVRIDYGIDLVRIDRYVSENPRGAVRRRLGIRPDDRLLLCIGTYEPRKAQGMLALAFSRAARDHPDAVLAMVGDQGGTFSDGLHRMVDRLGLSERTLLVPVTPDIDDWYRAADAFILASDIESLPRSMLEAMAFGIPVMATDVYGVPEVIQDGRNGFLFDASSVSEVSAVLERVLALPREDLQNVGEAGRKTVQANRSSDSYADAYRVLLEALLANSESYPSTIMK